MSAISPDAGGAAAAGDLFQILRDGRPRTRTEIAAMTGLARSTVALRVEALMRLGFVRHVGEAVSTGGRPSTQFAMDLLGRVVLAVDVGASHLRVALSDLAGSPVAERFESIRIADGPEIVLERVGALAQELLDEDPQRGSALLAVGVGLPGPVEFGSGRPVNPPIMPGWDRFDVAGVLGARFGVPVLVDNDVNIMALGERALHWPGVDHLLYVKVATGIGCGVISGGLLQRGAQGTAGDIGHVQLERATEVPCGCGNRGCLEAVASGPAVARALRALGVDAPDAQAVIDLVRNGQLDAIQAVRAAGRDVGSVLSTCVSLINPSVIVIGGSMAQAGEHVIAGVREVVYSRSMPLATEHLHIDQSRAGDRAAIHGAAILAVEHMLAAERIDAMTAA